MPRISERLIELMRSRGLISTVEAARRTGVNRSTITLHVESQRLTPYPSGRFLFVSESELKAIYPSIADGPVAKPPRRRRTPTASAEDLINQLLSTARLLREFAERLRPLGADETGK